MTNHEQNERWLEYLHAVQALSAQVEAAFSALGSNDLERFEACTAAQQRLAETVRGLSYLLRQNFRTIAPVLEQQIVATGKALQQQIRVYAVVLTRAAQAGSSLLALYQGSPRGYSQNGRLQPVTNTWSCEV